MVHWTAYNTNMYMLGRREADTILQAVRRARRYVMNELFGCGKIYYFEADKDTPFRIDERSAATGYKWEPRLIDCIKHP